MKRIWRDRKETFLRYYKSPRFALLDLTFGLVALFINPYRTCRKFLQKRGETNIYAYGETPYTTYQRIVEECGVTREDTWIEMGSGRGKGCFWIAHFVQCRVIGVEWIPQFVYIAKGILALFQIKNLTFKLEEMGKTDLQSATLIYLYGHFPSLQIPLGAKVLTISEPLEGLKVIKQFWVRYPWGRTAAYLHQN
jgi:hypothetical protein